MDSNELRYDPTWWGYGRRYLKLGALTLAWYHWPGRWCFSVDACWMNRICVTIFGPRFGRVSREH